MYQSEICVNMFNQLFHVEIKFLYETINHNVIQNLNEINPLLKAFDRPNKCKSIKNQTSNCATVLL